MERVLLEKLNGLQPVKKCLAFCGTRRFITTFTSARHLFLSWAISIQSIPSHPTSRRFTLILSSNLRLGLPSDPFPLGFPSKPLYTPLSSHVRATCPTHLILLDFITRKIVGEQYRSLRLLRSFLHSRYLVLPLLNTLFSNTLTLCFLPQCQRPGFTPTQKKRQNYSSVCLNL
jgi:hypothetical protein